MSKARRDALKKSRMTERGKTMARSKKTDTPAPPAAKAPAHTNLAELLSKETALNTFGLWVVGDTPLICHAWSQKAKLSILQKHVKAITTVEVRDPEQEFRDSLYEMKKGMYGFPVMAIKEGMLGAAHKKKGIPKTEVMAGLYLYADMYQVRPALSSAICDMPLVRVYGSDPQMREDAVKIGVGVTRTAALAYRAQFRIWSMKIEGEYDADVLTAQQLLYMVRAAGRRSGVGEWRNERKGIFGSFHVASVEEQHEWEAFAKGKGKMPIPPNYKEPTQFQQAAE
jgi:hypothetical protein